MSGEGNLQLDEYQRVKIKIYKPRVLWLMLKPVKINCAGGII
jgi:hypothetical protein